MGGVVGGDDVCWNVATSVRGDEAEASKPNARGTEPAMTS